MLIRNYPNILILVLPLDLPLPSPETWGSKNLQWFHFGYLWVMVWGCVCCPSQWILFGEDKESKHEENLWEWNVGFPIVNGSPGAGNTGSTERLITNRLVRLIQKVVIKGKLFLDPFYHQILLWGGGIGRGPLGGLGTTRNVQSIINIVLNGSQKGFLKKAVRLCVVQLQITVKCEVHEVTSCPE